MIHLCPYCGYTLNPKLQSGLTSCERCNRVFDDSLLHRLLSAAWVAKKWHITEVETLRTKCSLSQNEAELVYELMVKECHTHDEFCRNPQLTQILSY